MLAKDSVKSRLDSQAGLSFTEFSYQLFQAHDFRQLFAQEQCIMQVCQLLATPWNHPW